jgi:hypothetical protein
MRLLLMKNEEMAVVVGEEEDWDIRQARRWQQEEGGCNDDGNVSCFAISEGGTKCSAAAA